MKDKDIFMFFPKKYQLKRMRKFAVAKKNNKP